MSIRSLLQHGVSSQSVDSLLEEEVDPSSSHNNPFVILEHDIPHMDESTWNINCGREQAHVMLDSRANGTFLIRPSREQGKYALSLM